MKARLPPDETSPPERWGKWHYWCKEGPDNKDYPIFYRRRVGEPGIQPELLKDEVLLDLNELAEEFGYVHVGACEPSPDHRYLGYTLDATATESWTLFIKDLTTGKLLPRGTIQNVVSSKWAEDGQTVLYTQANELQIPTKIFSRRVLGPHASESEEDRLVYEEAGGPEWFADVSKTKDGKFLTINVNSRNCSEVYLLDAANPQTPLRLVRAREPGVEYFVEHHRGSLLILTNQGNPGGEYRLMCAPADDPGQPWKELLPADPRDVITDMDLFAGHCVMYTLRDGLPNVTVYPLTSPADSPLTKPLEAGDPLARVRSPAAEDGAREILPEYNLFGNGRRVFDNPTVCSIEPGANAAFEAESLRFTVSSPVTPDTVFDYDMSYHTLTRVKQITVPGLDVSPANATNVNTAASKTAPLIRPAPLHTLNGYTCTRVTATSADGTAVPVTVTHASDLPLDGRNPALLIGYGAYGVPQKTTWSSHTLSLLDRGWVVATAHVRGGGEFGKRWHEAGRKENKVRSFEDFEACAELLVKKGFADGGRLAAQGSSAGGLLVGAVVNRRPEFKAVILKVPFLDVLHTMLDPSLPLTAQEYEEWGNPAADRAAFERIRNYSPYDNVKQGARYPAMLITASMQDTRVGYWEAAKWVSKLRATVPTSLKAPILLFTSFNDGHFGQGGRYQQILFAAREQAFLLDTVGSREFRKREGSKRNVLELVKSVWRRTTK
ncbi:Prolyl oligopeptidase family protein [Klebsormidium nitens]|uniref:Prolyl endopeptidase n=1 Tax=Klebsormidium nitens TaxID=105231 RepID=A0A1Y1I2D0_KLENI|nr:Prolyl oligopeptidase family protein [Klebsormidium nitens]|eukprot:GAQ83341.1 Prolyl oligopeptidase family protein [Klebsormidium nitens]